MGTAPAKAGSTVWQTVAKGSDGERRVDWKLAQRHWSSVLAGVRPRFSRGHQGNGSTAEMHNVGAIAAKTYVCYTNDCCPASVMLHNHEEQ